MNSIVSVIITAIIGGYLISHSSPDSTDAGYYILAIGVVIMAVAPRLKKPFNILAAVIVFATFIGAANYGLPIKQQEDAAKYQHQVEEYTQEFTDNYQHAINILSKDYATEKDYKQAKDLLDEISRAIQYSSGARAEAASQLDGVSVLQKYADAMITYNGHDMKYAVTQYKVALDKFKDIPQDYDGPLADRIAQNRLRVKKDYEQAKSFVEGAAKEAAAEKAESEGKIVKVLGQPQTINTTKTTYGERKQYVYGDGRYVYTQNGVITGMQNIEHQY